MKLLLLGFVFDKQGVKAFVCNTTNRERLIELLYDAVKLVNALAISVQPPLGVLCRFLLP